MRWCWWRRGGRGPAAGLGWLGVAQQVSCSKRDRASVQRDKPFRCVFMFRIFTDAKHQKVMTK